MLDRLLEAVRAGESQALVVRGAMTWSNLCTDGNALADPFGDVFASDLTAAVGTYGRSVHSGQPIPDERLEADPLAELTVQEAAAAERGALEAGHDAVGLGSAGHPFEVLADADITPEEEQAAEEDDDEPAPEPSLGIHLERDDRTR